MYAAEIVDNVVQRVIVAPSLDWCVEHLGGTWIETADPYTEDPQTVTYCGPGWGADDRWPERFAPQWQPWDGTFEDDNLTRYQTGTLVFHEGRIWYSTTPNNVWEPGVSGWHDSPGDGVPQWVAPTGAQDAYYPNHDVTPTFWPVVTHNGQTWQSTHDGANVWEPGVFGWVVVAP